MLAWWEVAVLVGHVGAVLASVLLVAAVGRWMARVLRQPAVVGEIALGLAAGPMIVAVGGAGLLPALVPPAVFDCVRFVGHVGLVLFLVGTVHELRSAAGSVLRRAVGFTAAYATLIPLAAGGILAWFVLAGGDPLLRGSAPAGSLALLLAVSLSVTAVPVLARILADRGLTGTVVGRLSLSVAVIIDVVAWLLLAVAIGMSEGGHGGVARAGAALCVAALCLVAVRRVLATRAVTACCARFSLLAAGLIAGAGLVCSGVLQVWGLTEIFGAVLVGLAIPAGDRAGPWRVALRVTTHTGLRLVPVFFVVTGITVFAGQYGPVPWLAIAASAGLGVAGKLAGGYLGARHGGLSHHTGLGVAVLLNTRGLTELVVLQAGYSAGILTPAMYLALTVMALVTTGMAGPAQALLARRERHRSTTRTGGTIVRYACLPDLLREQIRDRPDHIAIVSGDECLTYHEFGERSAAVAARLRQLGVRPDDRVGILAQPSAEALIGVWGILIAGGAYVPLSPDYPEERLRFMVDDASVSLILREDSLREKATATFPSETETTLCPDNLAYLVYTSGSTGEPHGVLIEHRAIVNQLRWLRSTYRLSEKTLLHKTPASFDAAQWELLAPACGAMVVLASPGTHRDPERLIEAIVEHEVTTLQCVPTLLRALLDTGQMSRCTSLTEIFCGGETLTHDLAARCLETVPGCDLVNLYGPSEAAVNSTAFAVTRPFAGAG